MVNQSKTKKLRILNMLWKRKLYYFIGMLIGLAIGAFCKVLGSNVKLTDLTIVPLSFSFIFGYIIYLIIKEPDRLKREGRTLVLSKEGLFHLALVFGSMIVLGLAYKIIRMLV